MSARDWTDDFARDNGDYYCGCHECGQSFVGHKSRVMCKQCNDRIAALAVQPTTGETDA